MGKTLVIAEKPSVAADIARALGGVKKVTDYYEGDQYVIASAVGHLLELKAPEQFEVQKGKWNLENLPVIPKYFDLEPIKKSEAKLKSLSKLIKRRDVDKIINACDAGREGELIFRYIIDSVKTKKTLERLWLQSMTKQSILSAFQHLRSDAEMKNLADAAKSRSEADWLVGINGTRAMTAFNSKEGGFFLTTVGRVQTPTLALVVKREAEIQAFKPRDYWEVHADFQAASGNYEGRYINPNFKKDPQDPAQKADRLWTAEDAQNIVDKCKGKTGTVTEESKPTTSSCPALFDLTSLQREANNRFGFSAKTTLSIAQSLYEKHKALTYPRTDSRALPSDYVPTVKETMKMLQHTQWGKFATEVLDNGWVKPVKKIFDTSKISDHFAIIPTTQAAPSTLTDTEQKIYDLVVKRFLAVFFPPAQYKQITRKTLVEGYTFLSEGKVLQSPGWLAVYGKDASNPNELLVPITNGEKVPVHSIKAAQLATKPPARYTEATLLSAMENAGKEVTEEEYRLAMSEKGIGTPATRAAIIDGLKVQGYMILEGRDLVPTAKAKQLLTLLNGLKIKELSDAELTGEWEYQLSQIEKGKLSRSDFMAEIGKLTTEIVDKTKNYQDSIVPLKNPARLKAPCPSCGKGPIDEQYKRYVCANCGWSFAKQPGGRILEPAEAEELLTSRKIGPLDGFISKMRRPFSAVLKLVEEDGKWKVDFDFGDKPETPVNLEEIKKNEPLGTCPVCGKHPVFETDNAYVCEAYLDSKSPKKCTFRSSKVILQQPIEREQMKKLLESGSTDLLTGFVSNRTKKKFSASLVLEKGGKIGFKFEDKKPVAKTSTTRSYTRRRTTTSTKSAS